MGKKDRENFKHEIQRIWQGLGVLLGGLLLVDFLVCLISGLLAANWLLGQFGVPVFTAALLLLGILVYLPAKRLGVEKLPRQLLGGGLLGGAAVVVFFAAAYAYLFLYVL